jgi:regulator of RNase E activity RraA
VNQGDLLHADANGVTNIPPEIVSEMLDVADEFVASEAIMLDYVKAPGTKTVAKFAELRKEFQAIVANLTKRVSRKK